MLTTTIKATGLTAFIALSAALLLSCGGPKTAPAPEPSPEPVQKWQFFASKAEFPACGEDTRDQLFYDSAAQALYICHSAGDGYVLDEAELSDLKGDKGNPGDKGDKGDPGQNG